MRPLRLVSLAVCVACSGYAFAADDAEAIALPPVDVPMPDAEAAAVASHGSPSTRAPSAASTTVDVAAQRDEAKDVAALVSAVPGVIVSDAGGAGQRKTLSLRGVAPNGVLVLLDGVPLSGPGNAFDLSLISASTLDAIEVLRGPASAAYGPGAMGGVVNLVTRSPRGLLLFGDVSQGSFATTRLSVGASAPLLGGEGLALLHGLRSVGDFSFEYDDKPALEGNPLVTLRRDNNAALQGGGLLRYRRPLGNTTLDVTLEGGAEARGLAGPVQNPSSAASQRTVRGTLSAHTTTDFEAGGTLSVLAFGRVDDSTLDGMAFGAGHYPQLERAAGVEALYRRIVFGRHGLSALVSAGGDWVTEPTEVNPSQRRVGAMLGDEVFFLDGALTLDASVRVDAAGPFFVVSPRAGLVATLPHGFEVKASAGQASRPPSFSELYVFQGSLMPNPGLRPERALGVDATVAWSTPTVAAAVTGFASLYEDLIVWEYYPPALAKPFNVMTARVAGVEAEGRWAPARWFDASVAWTWLSTANLRDDPRYFRKALPWRPAHRVTARASGGIDGLRAHVQLLFQSTQYMNRTETLAIGPRAMLDAGLTATPSKHPRLTVGFELKNILDVQTQDMDGYPLPPRAAYLTLAMAWDGAKR